MLQSNSFIFTKHPIKYLWQWDDFVAFVKNEKSLRVLYFTIQWVHRATGIILFSVRWGLMSENALNYRRELCRTCHYSPWPTDIPFDILGPTWRLLWKASLHTTGHLFPQALECRSSGCLQTLAAGQSSPRWTVKALHTMCTLRVLTCHLRHKPQTHQRR